MAARHLHRLSSRQRLQYWKKTRAGNVSSACSISGRGRVSWRALVNSRRTDGPFWKTITIHAPESGGVCHRLRSLAAGQGRDVSFGKFSSAGFPCACRGTAPTSPDSPRSSRLRGRDCGRRARRGATSSALSERNLWHRDPRSSSNPNHPPGWRADEQGDQPQCFGAGRLGDSSQGRRRFVIGCWFTGLRQARTIGCSVEAFATQNRQAGAKSCRNAGQTRFSVYVVGHRCRDALFTAGSEAMLGHTCYRARTPCAGSGGRVGIAAACPTTQTTRRQAQRGHFPCPTVFGHTSIRT